MLNVIHNELTLPIATWWNEVRNVTLHDVIIDTILENGQRYIACREFCRLILDDRGSYYHPIDIIE